MEVLLGGIFFVVIPLVIVVGVVYIAVHWFRQNEARKYHEATHEVVESLRYHVPRGQDPAAVLAALKVEGYEAVYDDQASTPDVLILTPSGADRERAHVRAVLAHGTSENLEGDPQPSDRDIRFADE
jgi:predicted GTPase